ncbi:uncharacterized protein LOC127737347 [Mytilus californianus]|uniref:uncharacterized protein LOC127737347 n=1 Tax=Mytilus californianus TaxID=6549 RepID=UPI00224795E8|nr:uncharacterized protein LOC127737347 [Mytilus californianus]
MAAHSIPIMQTSYESGNCDFCKQRNVKVKPLNCKRHFYCRTCNDFSPKFQRKDFQCRACSERFQKRTEDNLKKVDNFLGGKIGGCEKQKDVNLSIAGGSIITFDKENLEEESDEDLTGNNDEWEHLLQTMTTEKQKKKDKPTHKRKKKSNRPLQLVPREMSFMKLVLPTATRRNGERSEEKKNENKNKKEATWCHSKEILIPEDNDQSNISPEESRPNTPMDLFQEERCTSPVKTPRQQKPTWGWIPNTRIFTDTDDDDDTIELVIDIEAPPDSPRSYDESIITQIERDAFWDF